ncbi:MAG: GNAT family N-acetyltransferase [Carboxylicivirga sp.]|jgi:hypothetical protein|nr:GNAT family N-acetyltransferase [Carboxylicivirga sp.]MCT4648295.1 GNAT family N-acetyltransferase [Carboxylicivirga sp.]
MLKILRAEVPNEYHYWLKVWNNWHEREVFAHPNYLQLYKHSAKAVCALYEKDGVQIIYPFCIRNINQDFLEGNYFDIITPYGYGDIYIIGNKRGASILEKFQEEFLEWAFKSNIVSEFVRFDLLSKSIRSYYGDLIEGTSNIICDLSFGTEHLWGQFKSKVRRNVNKAIKASLKFEVDIKGERINDFFHLYNQTMDRLQAKSKYYFPVSYFKDIQKELNGHCVFFFISYNDKPIASVLVLHGVKKMYYFLGGADSKYFDLRPNELLHFEIMKWGIENGLTEYVLGGGYSNNDSLFTFKKGFSPNGVHSFYCGQYVHNKEIYEQLVKQHELDIKSFTGQIEHSDFFPRYRASEKAIVI